jgi:hypothetical protein
MHVLFVIVHGLGEQARPLLPDILDIVDDALAVPVSLSLCLSVPLSLCVCALSFSRARALSLSFFLTHSFSLPYSLPPSSLALFSDLM